MPGSERVMASIQLKPGFKGKVTEDEIREFCRKHLAPYAVPKYVEFREEMPLTVTEKVFQKGPPGGGYSKNEGVSNYSSGTSKMTSPPP